MHDSVEAQEYCRERKIFLEKFVIKVLRFESRLVFQQAEGALMEIRRNFGWHGEKPPHPFVEPLLGKKGGK